MFHLNISAEIQKNNYEIVFNMNWNVYCFTISNGQRDTQELIMGIVEQIDEQLIDCSLR